ncbi:PXPV repeat protein [Paraburkholderia sp. DHOC27]|uniref:PXPV repeat protein n=1 Tax=Paraburkholderia sp. DHOC27 TaxID=2303330 RepID=UPI000E3C9968|nr:PXPV repeat protein [Paraburkholderia sp. DHOC27]RFU47475.1 hypothetical protein D0B32_15305 [Paraburkholderia sp. DHOC27]
MKRIVTHLLVAAGLAAGACGVAQAHTDLSVGLSLGVPAPVYVAPEPAYAQPVYYAHPGWDRGYYGQDHRGWDHGDRHGGYDHRDDHRGQGWHG